MNVKKTSRKFRFKSCKTLGGFPEGQTKLELGERRTDPETETEMGEGG